jgi:hypothetical protein
MDFTRLKAALSTFTDQPESLLLERGNLVVQLGDELISVQTVVRNGQVMVVEDDFEESAEKWLAHRIANLGLLADRILSAVPSEKAFVTPKGELVDQVERAPDEIPIPVDNALSALQAFLGRRPAGTCSVLYLTSDAGEGKTTLINQLARQQASEFRAKKSDWLLVPINLGGRPFLRFDDVVAAALLNQIHFRRLYFEAFLQLVRMGYIIPALDGFEEVFIETAEGDAVSSLGNLIRQMEGEGSLLIAARKAYFEFKGLDKQAKLLDALPNADVAFGRLKLKRWTKEEFLQYCRYNNVAQPEQLYDELVTRVEPEHPLLTRAVFVKRIVEIANSAERQRFLQEIRPETEDYFRPFIDKILDREIAEKWIDKFGEPPKPLLTLDEHHELLRLIAEEMWNSKTGSLSTEMCVSLTELFCEAKHLPPLLARQVRERILQHALLAAVGSARNQITFDHDHFREFFLGEQVGTYLADGAKPDLRKILRADIMPGWALDTAISMGLRRNILPEKLLQVATDTARSESPASFTKENCGALCIRLLERTGQSKIMVEDITFPGDALRGRTISNVEFKGCYFRPCALDAGHMENLTFQSCEFEHLEVIDTFLFKHVNFIDCSIHGLTIQKGSDSLDIYDPAKINRYCEMIGATIKGGKRDSASSLEEITRIDRELQIIRKLLMVFMRSTQVSENVLNLRLGVHTHKFWSQMRSELIEVGVLQEVKHTGGGSTHRYRLGKLIGTIDEALTASSGSYRKFLDFVRSQT